MNNNKTNFQPVYESLFRPPGDPDEFNFKFGKNVLLRFNLIAKLSRSIVFTKVDLVMH